MSETTSPSHSLGGVTPTGQVEFSFPPMIQHWTGETSCARHLSCSKEGAYLVDTCQLVQVKQPKVDPTITCIPGASWSPQERSFADLFEVDPAVDRQGSSIERCQIFYCLHTGKEKTWSQE